MASIVVASWVVDGVDGQLPLAVRYSFQFKEFVEYVRYASYTYIGQASCSILRIRPQPMDRGQPNPLLESLAAR